VARAWDPDTLQGTRLGGCVLEEVLGTGGMGVVYVAQQERPRRRVAVKVLHRDLAEDPGAWKVFLGSFRREADAAAALDHANIVPIYAFGERSGLAYLVMPYLADGSLAGLIQREGALPLPRVARYVEQLAAALDHAHGQGIVHRDVKASNVLLHPDGRLLLTDFGIAQPLAAGKVAVSAGRQARPKADVFEPAQAGAVVGTPEYMAPEQARGEPALPASDVYALGVLAYVMLTSKMPFTGPDTASVLTQQVSAAPPPLRAVRADLPDEAESAVLWALAKDPAQRPPSAEALARALRAASAGQMWDGKSSVYGAGGAPASAGGRVPAQTIPLAEMARRMREQSVGSAGDEHVIAALADSPTLGGGTRVQWTTDSGGDGSPAWPVPVRPRRGGRAAVGAGLALLAAVAVVVVAFALVVSLLNAGGAPTRTSGTLAPTLTAAAGLATVTPSPRVRPSPSPKSTRTAPANWLSVAPRSVKLGCKGSSRSATVILSNAGPSGVGWQAQVASPNRFSVVVTPASGAVAAGGSTSAVITNQSFSGGASGTVYFVPTDPRAGNPAAVHFTAISCLP
jgi:Protein kinase domain